MWLYRGLDGLRLPPYGVLGGLTAVNFKHGRADYKGPGRPDRFCCRRLTFLHNPIPTVICDAYFTDMPATSGRHTFSSTSLSAQAENGHTR